MPDFDTNELLIASGVITREVALRAAQVPHDVAASRVGRLAAAGADLAQMLALLSKLTGLPAAPEELLGWATPVLLLPSTARQLQAALACPVRRDPQGTLHVVVADPETFAVLDKLLIDFKVYLAPEARVRTLLANLYSLGAGGAPAEAIEIDLEASRKNVRAMPESIDIDFDASQRMAAAPLAAAAAAAKAAAATAATTTAATTATTAAATTAAATATAPALNPLDKTLPLMAPPPSVSADPLAPRASGSFKKRVDDDETMRIQRAPRGPAATAPTTAATPLPANTPVAVVQERAIREAPSSVHAELAAATKAAFVRGVVVGAAVTGVVAAIIIAVLLAR